jgi:hypothetical protein
MNMKPIIVIPIFDEAATIGRVVEAARVHAPVIVVDDGSRDDGGAVAARAGAEVLRHPRRLGKAQALLTGVAAARRRGATAVVTLDGDGQHDPRAVPTLLTAAAGRAIVVGSRMRAARGLPADRRNAIRLASFFAGWASGLAVRDSQSGFRVYPMALLDQVPTRHGGFVFETEILLSAAARGWTVEEVDVAAIPRSAARSRFRPLRDGAVIAAFLAGRVVARWGREARTVAAELGAVFRPERLAVRHAAILAAAAPYTDSPGRWSAAFGAAAARRAAARLATVWRDASRRGAGDAALGTVLAPVAIALLLAQALGRERLPDVVTPLVDRLYGPDEPGPAVPAAVAMTANALAERR